MSDDSNEERVDNNVTNGDLVSIDINLRSFYFNNPKQPTGDEINFVGRYTEDIPVLRQENESSAVLEYSNGLIIGMYFPTEGVPSQYENLEYITLDLPIVSSESFRFKGNVDNLVSLREYIAVEEYPNIYVYTTNLTMDCNGNMGVTCSNNQVNIDESKNIYLICASRDSGTLDRCDNEVKQLSLNN